MSLIVKVHVFVVCDLLMVIYVLFVWGKMEVAVCQFFIWIMILVELIPFVVSLVMTNGFAWIWLLWILSLYWIMLRNPRFQLGFLQNSCWGELKVESWIKFWFFASAVRLSFVDWLIRGVARTVSTLCLQHWGCGFE